ncbi:MAG: copper oxidase [Planctomycetes bacterium]|nr:copper oxidase [Planctomycetota bacterium]MCB9884074.1 copper oxidase [Planctomycetota bacterium]
MKPNRRQFLAGSALAGITSRLVTDPRRAVPTSVGQPLPPGLPGVDYRPVEAPDMDKLPWKIVNGRKVFHLVAEPVEHEFAPGMRASCWGYNGRVHGPVIEAVEGDRVRIYVTNRLDVATSVHWHGVILPNGMDGVAGLTQRQIEPGETFLYEFTLRQHGTLMYHPHHDEMTQMAMGMMGMIVVHPRVPQEPQPDRDFVYMIGEWALPPGARRPDPNEMTDFNVLTLNGKVFPGTSPMVVKTGERVRIRIGNLSAMDHHPMHLHGYAFEVTETDGGVIPPTARWPETTVLVATGSTRTVEFVADAPGDWAFHCHMTHHVMTQMGHGIPNLVGLEPGTFDARLEEAVPEYANMGMDMGGGHMAAQEQDPTMPPNSLPMMGGPGGFGYITMGGMFTVLKVRDGIDGYADPGWYKPPQGTLADVASAEDLQADGVDVGR